MTRFDDLDRALAAYLDGEATMALVPDGLLDETLAVTTARSPRPRWHAWLSTQRAGATPSIVPGRQLVAIAFVLLALLVALLAVGLIGGPRRVLQFDVAPNPTASSAVAPPSAAATANAPARPMGEAHRITKFPRPFMYRELAPTPLTKVSGPGWMVAFTSSGSTAYPSIRRDGTFEPGAWGITISSAESAVTHPCPGVNGGLSRVSVNGRDPRMFLEDLRTIGGIEIGELVDTTFDGRPAIAVTIDPGAARCDAADFHVNGASIGGGYVQLRVPSRLLVTDVDGMPIVLQVWASTSSDLEAVLPAATSFLDNVRFTGELNP